MASEMTTRHTRIKVVLLYGMFGFERILWHDYFHGVQPMLENMGMQVIVPRLSWGGCIKKRATNMARRLKHENGRLHLIAHSMGGVDARYYITHVNGCAKVASLTTLCSPHRGSAAAPYALNGFSPLRLFAGIKDLTPESMRIFNEQTPDHPDVAYRSYSSTRPLNEQPWPVRRYGRIIQAAEGSNDSQVSTSSATWGEHVRTLHADHFEIIGLNIWLNPFHHRKHFDHLSLFREIGEWIARFEKQDMHTDAG